RNATRHTELAVFIEYGHRWAPRRKGDATLFTMCIVVNVRTNHEGFMIRTLLRCVLTAILACTPAFITSARADITRFDLSGTVTDGTGAVLPGVTVTLKNADTGFNRSVVTDAAGRYSFNAIDPTGKWS